MIRIIPRRRINLSLSDAGVFIYLLITKELIKGKHIKIFERAFARYIGAKFALGVSSGRIGLRLILESLGLVPGDEIILPAFTFAAVPKIIKECGFKPLFVDIDRNGYNIDPSLIGQKITPRTKALIATHIFGSPCDIGKMLEIAKKHKLIVIEDCAQAIGATYNGEKVGSFGLCSFFSFESVKPFSTFGGGAVVTKDANLFKKIEEKSRQFSYPRARDISKRFIFCIAESVATLPFIFPIFIYPVLFYSVLTGRDLTKFFRKAKHGFKKFEVKFSNFQAAIGLKKLKDLDRNISKRVYLASILNDLIKNNFKLQENYEGTSHVYYNYVLENKNAKTLSKELFYRGIDTDNFFHCDCSELFTEKEDFPIAKKAINELIQLPLYHQLNKKDILYIANTLNKISNG